MGGIIFDPGELSDNLSEQVGYKAGLALSVEAMCDLVTDSPYADLIIDSETNLIRIRSEEYEELFFKLLHRIGHTEEEYNGDYTGGYIWHKFKEHTDIVNKVTELFLEMWPSLMSETERQGSKSIDPTPFMYEAKRRYGRIGFDIAYERVMAISRAIELNPHSILRRVEWKDVKSLWQVNGTEGLNFNPSVPF
jgi:restriction system protein